MTALPRYTCNRCGHEWIPRTDHPPAVCPSPACKSPYWNKPRRFPKRSEAPS